MDSLWKDINRTSDVYMYVSVQRIAMRLLMYIIADHHLIYCGTKMKDIRIYKVDYGV